MALNPGTKLGPYEIVSQIGAGGMGEVYKAADTRLNRTVAIKVLPAHFSQNLEMKQRFEREAQTIASLNHPNICTLYDVGRQEGSDFLVMEYLDGETLAQRLVKGPLPLEEGLKAAIAIADALDKAHNHGVTHRDLKPGNVMLTQSGAKLLDFGLAKLQQAPQSSKTPAPTPATGDTTPGTILGTMQYMAPEQLEGKEADARTDIFAFGAMLYEMISGKKAFDGRSQALLIASIMSADPEPLSKIQSGAPPALDFLIKRCLAKDPEERLQTAWDLMCHLQWIAEGGTESGAFPVTAAHKTHQTVARAALAVVALLIAVMALPAFRYLRGANTTEETRFVINMPDMPVPEAVSISPDGRWIAYSGRDGSASVVFARPIGSETATKLLGTDGAGRLFWSPDSRWIGFYAAGKLKKVEAMGGPPQNICETPDLLGGTWNSEDTILFASSKGLQRVAAAGGDPVAVSPTGAPAGAKLQEPLFLPDGHHYVYLASASGSGSAIYASAIDSKDSTLLVKAESNAAYAEPGYLFYHREGTLYAQPFNAGKLSFTGDAVRVADRVPYGMSGAGAFAASQTGTLIFRNSPPNAAAGGTVNNNVVAAPLLWLTRSGAKATQAAAQAGWAGVDLSPDGKRLAAHRHDPDGGDIWIFEAGKDTPSKFTFDAASDNSMPVWSPDGTRIAFGSRRNGKWGLYSKTADNTRNEELLWESDNQAAPMGWSPDGKLLIYWAAEPKTGGDIWALPLSGEKKPIPILQTTADERHPQVSPDGKWIAYSSNETGRSEIYIKSFPEGPAKIQVSVNGGVFPRWRKDGKELYFMNLISLGAMMAAEIRTSGSSIQRDVPNVLFQSVLVTSIHSGGLYHPYAVSPSGQQFLMPQFATPPELYNAGVVARGRAGTLSGVLPSIVSDRHSAAAPAASSTTPLMVVLNWTAGLNLRTPR
jgi:Tol biopolymer transport system component